MILYQLTRSAEFSATPAEISVSLISPRVWTPKTQDIHLVSGDNFSAVNLKCFRSSAQDDESMKYVADSTAEIREDESLLRSNDIKFSHFEIKNRLHNADG